jgi:hypothetical protein
MALVTNITTNQTICGCDGGLTIYSSGGNPPYSYSIDNGLTFNSFPIYSNLCEGNYVVIVNDISGETTTNVVTLQQPQDSVTYQVYLNTTSNVISSSPSETTTEYLTTLNVFPSLVNNINLNFTLNHSFLTKSSPNFSSTTTTSVSQLSINSTILSASTSGITTGSTYNPIPGCQGQTLFLETFNETWPSINYNFGDSFSLITTTTLYKNDFVDCYVGDGIHTFSLSNLTINGCDCCNIITT